MRLCLTVWESTELFGWMSDELAIVGQASTLLGREGCKGEMGPSRACVVRLELRLDVYVR